MSRKYAWFGAISLIVIFLLAAGYFFAARTPVFYGAVIDPPKPIPEIIATDSRGHEFRLGTLRGKVVLLYFGYLNCPLECPLTMAHLKQTLDLLGPAAQDVQVVMVSTDPVRDTPQAMTAYLAGFNPSFLGITGAPSDLAEIYRKFGVVVLEGGETHSSFTYVIDPQGDLRLTFVPDSSPEDIAHDLRNLLTQD
jgi:protein SCO1